MNDEALIARLRAVTPPDPEGARQRAVKVLVAEESEAPTSARSRWRWAIGCLAAALFVLSPPGQAVAERLGELVGIGDESSVTEPDLRDPRLDNSQDRVGPAIVTATGTLPGVEESFEILAWAGRYKGAVPAQTQEPTKEGEIVSCMGSVYPALGEQWTTKICLGPREEPSDLHVISVSRFRPVEAPAVANAPYTIEGQVSEDTARVALDYRDEDGSPHEVDATLGIATPEIAARTEMEQRFGFFVGSIPYDGSEPIDYGLFDAQALRTLRVTTYDADGQVIRAFDEGARYSKAIDQQLHGDILAVASIYAACQRYANRFPPAKCDRAEEDAAQTPGAEDLAGTFEFTRFDDVGVIVERGDFETLLKFSER